MSPPEYAVHGGNVRGIVRTHGGSVSDYLDFSANINSLGPPAGVKAVLQQYARDGSLTRYPEPGLPDLAAALARERGVAPHNITIHAGSAALFDVILRARAPRRLGICIPAFGEYVRAAAANSIEVRTFPLDVRGPVAFDAQHFCTWVRHQQLDAVVLTNPHNPLGFALPAASLRELRAQLPATTVIIDEAFADYDESVSLAHEAASDSQLIVVRSVTKFYAIPDLRVGYAVTTASFAQAMSKYIPAWPVSGIAAAAAEEAVADKPYGVHTQAINAAGRAQLQTGLTRLGLRVLPSGANFLTIEVANATTLCARLLADHRIIVRDCSSFAGLPADTYIRVAVRSADDNARLLRAIDTIE